jgi:hypothetical protein
MRYLKTFEGSPEYKEYIKSSNLANSKRIELVQSIVDQMSPKPDFICQEIEEIFESWKDEGVEFDDIELVALENDGDGITVYYPLGWKGRVESHYHPTFGSKDTDELITKILKKNPQVYYDITFGIDLSGKAKSLTGAKYFQDIDWNSEVLDPFYDTMRQCASELWSRLNSMYSIECMSSKCYIPGTGASSWSKCDPQIGNVKTGKISWILKIND